MSERPAGSPPENDIDNVEASDTDEATETLPRLNVEPIRTVVRELTRPDGSTVTVEVPVYPPFEMKDLPSRSSGKAAANSKRPRSK